MIPVPAEVAAILSALRGAGLVAPDAVAVLECAREAEIDPGEEIGRAHV